MKTKQSKTSNASHLRENTISRLRQQLSSNAVVTKLVEVKKTTDRCQSKTSQNQKIQEKKKSQERNVHCFCLCGRNSIKELTQNCCSLYILIVKY